MQKIRNPLTVVNSSGGNKLVELMNETLTELTAQDLDGATQISVGAFEDQKNLLSVEIPGSVKNIKSNAFSDCSNLSSLVLNEGLEEIGSYAFTHCALHEFVVPSTVNLVYSNICTLDWKCDWKLTVKMLPVTPPRANITSTTSRIFSIYDVEKIIVPVGSGNAYKTASNWSYFADLIVEG